MKTDAASLTASCIQKWRWKIDFFFFFFIKPKNWMTPLVHFISTLQCLSLICLILSRKNRTECCFNALPLLFPPPPPFLPPPPSLPSSPPPPPPLQHHHVMQTALHCCQRLPVQPQAPVCVSVLMWTKATASPPAPPHTRLHPAPTVLWPVCRLAYLSLSFSQSAGTPPSPPAAPGQVWWNKSCVSAGELMALTLLLLIADLGKDKKTKPRSSGQMAAAAAADHKLHLQSSGCPANVIYCIFGGP